MNLEVERKFRLINGSQFRGRLALLGIALSEPQLQIDQYFAHPGRDFAITDEALRVRFAAGRCALTYKGPKVDQTTKSRAEIELPFDPSVQDPNQVAELLEQLGFRPVAKVLKRRRTGSADRYGQAITIDHDDVQGLGEFVELEVVCNARHADAARSALDLLSIGIAIAGGHSNKLP